MGMNSKWSNTTDENAKTEEQKVKEGKLPVPRVESPKPARGARDAHVPPSGGALGRWKG